MVRLGFLGTVRFSGHFYMSEGRTLYNDLLTIYKRLHQFAILLLIASCCPHADDTLRPCDDGGNWRGMGPLPEVWSIGVQLNGCSTRGHFATGCQQMVDGLGLGMCMWTCMLK